MIKERNIKMAEDMKNTIKELTLMLMYLTSWKEKVLGAWHGISKNMERV
ncbi:hypothetical protein [Caproiciproducens sp. MSJ-32]|nr:hypothetical protein [Caproiciproducens sp. MSJ-32]